MQLRPYRLGILVGRFQALHLGHQEMIQTAVDLCDEVGIFLGSSQESRTIKNPFTWEERKRILKTVFPQDSVSVYPLPDIFIGNTSRWGEYVLDNVRKYFGMLPDLLISGKEIRRISWFDGMNGVSIAELYIPKSIDISASEMREFFLNDDRASWERYTDPVLYPMYEKLREIVVSCKDNTESESI